MSEHFVPDALHARVYANVVRGLGAGLPWRWKFGLMDAFERSQDVQKLRNDISAIKVAINATDDELREEAKRAAALCVMQMRAGDKGGALITAHAAATRHGVPLDKLIYSEPLTYHRMNDDVWWLRQIRRSHALTMEAGAVRLGLVHRGHGGDCYVSRESVKAHRQQQKRNRKMIEACDVVASDGERMALADIVDASISNKAIRRGELMTRLRGFQMVADDLKHVAVFATITCPSRMHHCTGGDRVRVNPNYDNTTPKQAQAYLCGLWARIRAKLARLKVSLYGFRTVEAHHDGCPHWHLLLWCPTRAERTTVREVIADYALRDSSGEPGAAKHRVLLKNMWAGKAVNYVAKYIAKGTDGFGLSEDLFGNPIVEATEALQVWASRWGVRQFQQIGGPPIGLWRELRRVDEKNLSSESAFSEIVATTNKDESGRVNFAGFIKCAGGAVAKRKDRPFAVGRVERYKPTRYGDRFVRSIKGVVSVASGEVVDTRQRVWKIERRSACDSFVETGRALIERNASIGSTWTSVNNCTVNMEGLGYESVLSSSGELVARVSSERNELHGSRGLGDGGGSVVSDRWNADS